MDTFFAQIIQPGEDEPSFWQGTRPNEFNSPSSLVDSILPFACKVDKDVLIANLLQDKQNDDERIYSIDGDHIW